jgi:hypothetical protein
VTGEGETTTSSQSQSHKGSPTGEPRILTDAETATRRSEQANSSPGRAIELGEGDP